MRRWVIAGVAATAVGVGAWVALGLSRVETPPALCPAQALGARLGVDHVMFGAQADSHTVQEAGFVARYRYLAGPVPEPGCASCQTCEIDGVSCENPDGCGWWGCWQDDNLPPGRIAVDFADGPQSVSIVTYYTWLAISGGMEGKAEIEALADDERVTRWLSDFRFFAQTVSDSGTLVVHMEPDLLGFLHKASTDPTAVPVDLSGVEECADLPHTAASLIPCWRAVLSTHAPQALLGVHASAWAAGQDVMRARRQLDVQTHASRTAAFLVAAGLDADVLVVEASDRDAGFDGDAWDSEQPSLTRALEWATALTQATELPHLWWQVPMGTPGLDNTCGRYVDDRVMQFVAHREAVAQAGAIGVVFGAGTECMTTAESDGGAFLAAVAPAVSDPPVLCGAP